MKTLNKSIYLNIIYFMASILIFCSCFNLLNDTAVSLRVTLFVSVIFLLTFIVKSKNIVSEVDSKIIFIVYGYILIYTISFLINKEYSILKGLFGYILGGSFFVAAFIISRRSKQYADKLLYAIAGVISIISAFSIDMASIQFISTYMALIIKFILGINPLGLTVFEEGSRLRSILTNPNIFASLTIIAVFICLYLYKEETFKNKKYLLFMLFINMTGFVCAFSLGTILSTVFVLTIYLIINRKNNIKDKLYLIIAGGIFTGLNVAIGFCGFGKTGIISYLPVISLVIFYLLFKLAVDKKEYILDRLKFDKKKCLAISVLLLIIVALASVITKPVVIGEESKQKNFSVPLKSGEYILKLEFSEQENNFEVNIYSQSYKQASRREYTPILSEAVRSGTVYLSPKFAVPSDNASIKIEISSESKLTLLKNSILDENNNLVKNIKTNRLLIPDFMENRLQAFSVNQNAVQRFVFFEDGLKIWLKSPIIGSGPAAFMSRNYEVKESDYATDSSHNYFIDILAETGIIGFTAFIGLMIYAGIILTKNIRGDMKDICMTLLILLLFIMTHSFIELNFIYIPYVAIFFTLLGIIGGLLDKEETKSTKIINVTIISIVNIIGLVILITNFM